MLWFTDSAGHIISQDDPGHWCLGLDFPALPEGTCGFWADSEERHVLIGSLDKIQYPSPYEYPSKHISIKSNDVLLMYTAIKERAEKANRLWENMKRQYFTPTVDIQPDWNS